MPREAQDDQVPEQGSLHHVEIWVPALDRAIADWAWLLEALGYTLHQSWDNGRSWRLGTTYLVFEQSPALTQPHHDRLAPGLNHLAFHINTPHTVDLLTAKAQENGWTLLFPDTHPHMRRPPAVRGLPGEHRPLRN